MRKNKPTPTVQSLFEPRSIAVIGASASPGKIGHSIMNNIVSGGYRGSVYPVNPKGGDMFGLPVARDINDIEDDIDLVSISVPAPLVLQAVEACARKGVKHIQIITSGFSEIGNTEEEHRIADIARDHGIRVLGPNIFGLFSAAASLNATFSASTIPSGHVAILTQSGALGIAMIGKTGVENIGLSAIVSLGNKCDLDEADLLEYLVAQEQTKVILMYIEGVKDGEELISALNRATRHKPIVVIKSGRSKRGAMAAASHTGSLAGSDAVFDAIMRQCGVLRADSIEEAFNWCKFLAFSPLPSGNNTVIVTNGGGVGVMATDACERFGIELLDDQAALKKIFGPATPSFGSTKNPIDITGGAGAPDYELALSAPVGSEQIDATIALYCETATFDSNNLAAMISDTFTRHRTAGKPISYAVVGGEKVDAAMRKLVVENVPVYADVYDAVSAMGAAYRYRRFQSDRPDQAEMAEIDLARIEAVIDNALAENRTFLLSNEGAQVMEAAGITIPQTRVVKNIDAAVHVADEIGYPVVLKIVSRDILHKSDAGGVALDLDDRTELVDAYEAILHNARQYDPNATIDGVEVAEMIRPGTELIVGARVDQSFGPVVMCGFGGIYVEVMKDVAFRASPLHRNEVLAMLKEIRSFPILMGVRGEKQRDIDTVIDTIIRISTIIERCKKITDIEINPIVVYGQGEGIKALDARILISKINTGGKPS